MGVGWWAPLDKGGDWSVGRVMRERVPDVSLPSFRRVSRRMSTAVVGQWVCDSDGLTRVCRAATLKVTMAPPGFFSFFLLKRKAPTGFLLAGK